MSCRGGVSNYERKKKALYNVNLWKSNFINIWLKYGSTMDIEGVQCFNYYKIDGDGEGQRRMSKHLKQHDLWSEVEDSDLEWVHLVFNLSKLISITEESIAAWITSMQESLEEYALDRLKYTIAGGKLTAQGIYDGDTLLDGAYMKQLALLLGMYQVEQAGVTDIVYDESIDTDTLSGMIPPLAAYEIVTSGGDNDTHSDIVFDFPMIQDTIAAWQLSSGIGTDSLDALVGQGTLVGFGNLATGTMTYALPVDVARRMNGYAFVKLVQKILDLDYKKTFWAKLKGFAGLIVAAIAAYFGYYELALKMSAGWLAGKMDLGWIGDMVAIYNVLGGDFSNVMDLSVSEATQLLGNIYSLYIDLNYHADTGADDVVEDDQQLFYKAPYEAYSGLYCYKPLISVSNSALPKGRYR